jgi:hypothetical protein
MSTIITRNSATSGSVPSSLIQGELAINVTDGRLFYGSGSGNIVKEFVASGSGGGTFNTGSFVTTSSFNAYTGSNTSQFAGTASYATTASYYGGSVLSASYAQTASYAPAYLPLTGGTINGNVTVNGTASIAFLNVTYESASVIYSSGSNQFGDASNDVQTLWGTVDIKSGPVLVTGSVIATSGFTGSLQGTASYATNALSASYAPDTTFPYTGSAGITGSLTVVGKTQSTQIGAGTSPSGSVPLDVRAQGALSTDLAFRVRNSGDTKNIFKIQGDANAALGELTDVGTKTFSVNTYGNPRFVLGTGYSTDTGVISITRRQGGVLTDNTLLLSQNAFADGNQVPYKHQYVNPSSYYGLNIPAYGYNAGFMWFKDSATIANLQMKLSPDNALSIYTSSASPIETIITGSAFQLWASGSLGNAKPYIRTQNGTLLYLGDQSQLYNVTASSITSSFTGSLLGTASYATNALSASYAPSTPAFPFTGSAGITGSLTVVGPTTSTQIGAGAAPSGSVPLDVRAQGTLATDIALRVRNSVNAANTFEVRGDGNAVFGGDTTSNRFLFGDAFLLSGGTNIARYAGSALIKHRFTNNGTTAYFEIDPANSIIYSDSSMNMSIGASTAGAKLDVRAQGALSTNLAFRVRNSADTANLGAIYGNGTVNLGNSNFDFQSTETSGRTAVIGASNTGASYNTYSILSLLGHNNSIASYGHTSYVGINSSINQNSGGTVTGMGESNTLSGGTIGIGMNNSIAGNANNNMNSGIGYNNAIQYEKTNTFLLGNNLRVSAAGAASMTKIGWANSAGTLAQIDRSFEVYLNGQSGSDFHVTGKTNVVLKNNSVLVSGTNYEAAATNVLTIHNGVAPITNIAGAFQLYSTASTAGNAKPYFRTENGTVVWLGDESRLFNVTASRTIISSSQNTISGSSLTVYGSGSAQPVFTVQGSQGELFSITDSLSGSLFSVNDISGLPIMEVFSDNTTLMGSYLAPSLNTTAKVVQTNSGSFTLYSLPTASYDTAFFEYSVRSGSNARAGTIMAVQLGSAVNFTETTTTDFGSTSAVSFTVIVTGSNIALTGSSTSGAWTIKTIVRSI